MPREEPTGLPATQARRLSYSWLLETRTAYGLCVVLAMAGGSALRWGAMQGSLLADDWDHYAMYAGIYPVARGPLDMFNFIGASAADRNALLGSGRLPWWTASDIQLAAFRPLSSALVYFDFSVLDGAHVPKRLHLHSLFWWLVLIAGVAALLRSLLPPAIAALALLIYAFDDAHVLPVTWAANRSEIVAIALATWGLWAHVAGRARGWPIGRPAGFVLIALGLLAGEHALAPLAYFAAFELAAGKGSLRTRLCALLPYAILMLVYVAVRTSLHYGVAGSDYYIDPAAEPLRYATVSLARLPLLLGDLLFAFASEWQYWEPAWRHGLIERHFLPDSWLSLDNIRSVQRLLGWSAVVAVTFAIARLCRAGVSDSRRTVGWLLLGGCLSLVPMCGTLPMSRLTVAAAIGFDAFLGWLLWTLLSTCARPLALPRRAAALLGAALLVALHLVYAGVRNHDEVAYYSLRSRLEETWVMGTKLAAAETANKQLILISARDWASQFALPLVWHLHGRALPRSCDLLSAASDTPIQLQRLAPNVFDLRYLGPHTERAFGSSVYRSASATLRVGEWYRYPRFSVMVMAAEGGEPTQLRFMFPASLDDPRYVLLYPRSTGITRLVLPAVGGSIGLPPPAWPTFAKH